MAEAVAAFYAVETVAEGAVAGALAVSGSTVPLHVLFQHIKSPSSGRTNKNSTANIVKNKIYLIGGEQKDGSEHGSTVLSFPSDWGASRNEAPQSVVVDCEIQNPIFTDERRPLQSYSDRTNKDATLTKDQYHHASLARTKHSSVVVDDRIYVLGGLTSVALDLRGSNTSNIISLDTIVVYDTLRPGYSALVADPAKGTEGIPEPRYSASCTSSPYPRASLSADKAPSFDSHGKIFLHGGYDVSGQPLHDTWTFDISTRAWHKFPTVLEETLSDQALPGKIVYVNHVLWYINGSTVMYLELAEYDPENSKISTQDSAVLSTGRVGSGQWQVVYPPAEEDQAALRQVSENLQERQQTSEKARLTSAPTEPTGQAILITTGGGRMYLLSTSSQNPQSMYTFQIPSSPKTLASIKDTIRDRASQAISSLPDSWKSGKYEWSEVEIVQSSKKEGQIGRPSEELEDYSLISWDQYANKLVLWGGCRSSSGIVENEGWVLHFD